MENLAEGELKNLANELTLGKELAMQLLIHLNAPSSSHETRELLVRKLLNSYDKALHMLKAGETTTPHVAGWVTAGMTMESPPSQSVSPRSEDSDLEFNRDHQNNPRETPRKRKNMPRWTKHVRVSPGTGLEGPLDDGYTWRKYGQKNILGAKYPRGYYRCTLRHVQGCLATKQVQRTDADPTVFEITYLGRHTCNQGSELNSPPSTAANQDPSGSGGSTHQPQQDQQNTLISFQTGLEVKTDNLGDLFHQPFGTLSFATSSTADLGSYPFFNSSVIDMEFGANVCPSLTSPTTSGSNYFNVSLAQDTIFSGNLSSHASESELADLVAPAATSATNSPAVGLEIPFGQTEFAPSFTSDNLGFFS